MFDTLPLHTLTRSYLIAVDLCIFSLAFIDAINLLGVRTLTRLQRKPECIRPNDNCTFSLHVREVRSDLRGRDVEPFRDYIKDA